MRRRATASASWPETRRPRIRARPRDAPAAPPPASFRNVTRSSRVARSAGRRLKTTGLRRERTTEKARTRRSTTTSSKKGSNVTERMRSRPQAARRRPRAPPARARTRPSVKSWRRRRLRLAPRAARTAVSRCRAAPRASMRLATFAQATASTRTTATASRVKATHEPALVIACRNGITVALQPELVAGWSRCSLSARARISAAASATSAPGFKRPVTRSVRVSRSEGSAEGPSGVHTSISLKFPISMSGLRTPATSCGSPSRRRVRPTTAGSEPK